MGYAEKSKIKLQVVAHKLQKYDSPTIAIAES
jgi:hypothetical protein